jgi:TolB-like protein
MNDRLSVLRSFLTELKRRKVYRVAVVYAVVAFVIWQAAEIAVPGLNLPGWVLTLVILLTVLGFPIAVVLAWAFDITPAGIERTPPEEVERAPAEADRPAPPRLSVAVLPFENLSADPENEYFSDGISEELLNTLARVPGLRVAARTSSFAFKGKSASIGEIGEALNVAHVVEGSVRRAGDRVRITAQLIDVADGYHLWSEGYDKELGDILMVQREIAESIGETLEAGLTRGWEDVLPAGRRVDPRAFDHYLRARFCLQRMTREYIDRALEYFQEALSIDPDFFTRPRGGCLGVPLPCRRLYAAAGSRTEGGGSGRASDRARSDPRGGPHYAGLRALSLPVALGRGSAGDRASARGQPQPRRGPLLLWVVPGCHGGLQGRTRFDEEGFRVGPALRQL